MAGDEGHRLTSVEICAGAGGQALGLEWAGFAHQALVEIDRHCCNTLRRNRPEWNVVEADIKDFMGDEHKGCDLLSGGVPCPPFSVAGKQLGSNDDRDLFPQALRLVDEIRPRAVMLENVKGFLAPVFDEYRKRLERQLGELGYVVDVRLMNASDFGVPQLRPRVVIIALRKSLSRRFQWPERNGDHPSTVGDVLVDLMSARGWPEANAWRERADSIAPTIVGGSKKHGGADLGPTRAKRAWAALGVDGHGIADEAPGMDFTGFPRLTIPMVARLQGFPDTWEFSGGKTAAYRQIGNAFPPPVAFAVGEQIRQCLVSTSVSRVGASP